MNGENVADAELRIGRRVTSSPGAEVPRILVLMTQAVNADSLGRVCSREG